MDYTRPLDNVPHPQEKIVQFWINATLGNIGALIDIQ